MKNHRLDKWSEDIDQLELELPKGHKNLFFNSKKERFHRQIQNLKNNIENYDDCMISVEIAAIAASARDAHTTVIMPITRFIPFEFYWFPEGIYIVTSSGEHTYAINCKVTHLNGIPMEEVIQRVESIVSHENDAFLRAQLPKYLQAVEVLYGLEIIDEFDHVELAIETSSGESLEITVPTYGYKELKGSKIRFPQVSEENLPLYRRNKLKNYWSHFIFESNTLYFNYKSCRDMQDITVEEFCIDLMKMINQEAVNRLVIDLRNNLGGNSTLLEPFISELTNCQKLNRVGGIYVILGREAFSSALLNAYALKNKTSAIFIGEATGGKPNCYGEVKSFELRNSKLQIRYSTKYYKIIEDDEQESFFQCNHK
ncbi:MAG: hypothetical protein K0S75_711 [Clostridia bacterium]|nr:hypothetical protein [Clostridia bacterium]